MDSDDEFSEVGAGETGVQFEGGLNVAELLGKGGTSFSIRPAFDDNAVRKQGKKESTEEYAIRAMEDEFYKQYSVTKAYKPRGPDGKVIDDVDETNFESIKKSMHDITEDGKIKKLIVEPGFGKQIEPGQIVYMHYIVAIEGDESSDVQLVIDSSRLHKSRGGAGAAFRFKAGGGGILPVLDYAVLSMQPGEVSKFLSHWDYAYRKLGHPDLVPPESWVLITIQIIKVEDGSVKCNIFDMEKEDRMRLPFDDIFKGVKELKTYGNDAFKAGDYDQSRIEYKKALGVLNDIITAQENQNKLKLEMLYTLYINIAQCHILCEKLKRAKEYCEDAIKIPIAKTKKTKAYYRLAFCCHSMGSMQEALDNIQIAKGMNACDPDIDKLYTEICKKMQTDKETEKEYTQKMFKKLTLT